MGKKKSIIVEKWTVEWKAKAVEISEISNTG